MYCLFSYVLVPVSVTFPFSPFSPFPTPLSCPIQLQRHDIPIHILQVGSGHLLDSAFGYLADPDALKVQTNSFKNDIFIDWYTYI